MQFHCTYTSNCKSGKLGTIKNGDDDDDDGDDSDNDDSTVGVLKV